jgi:tRNA-uridine 2-sulfurtransferase
MVKRLLDIDKDPKDTFVVVAMSGGVDSSTVAAMMVDAGYRVVGVTMQLYDMGVDLQKKGACCAGQDIYDAKEVADKLGIPHYILNYENKFKEAVIDEFVDSYISGYTPIPCVRCNQTVKFKDMLGMAKDLKADALVTGHYVRRVRGDEAVEMHRALDKNKDQTYFLFTTTKEQLEYVHFPLGEYTKEETRELAEKYGLAVADKPDSQDICFVPNGSYASVIEKFRPGALDPGKIVHADGTILGEHDGIINYTVGQRRGLGVSHPTPLYVIKLDPVTKEVIVGPEDLLEKNHFFIKDVNWLGKKNGKPLEVLVKVRYRQDLCPATIEFTDGNVAKLSMLSSTKAVTPGQACVVYDGDRLLGGGWITKEIW